MKRRPKQIQPADLKTAVDVLPPLAEDNPLLGVVGEIAPHEYARVSAREFAIGKYSKRRQKRRYAIT